MTLQGKGVLQAYVADASCLDDCTNLSGIDRVEIDQQWGGVLELIDVGTATLVRDGCCQWTSHGHPRGPTDQEGGQANVALPSSLYIGAPGETFGDARVVSKPHTGPYGYFQKAPGGTAKARGCRVVWLVIHF